VYQGAWGAGVGKGLSGEARAAMQAKLEEAQREFAEARGGSKSPCSWNS